MCGFVDKLPSVGPKQDADVNLFLQKCAVLIHSFFFLWLPCLCLVVEVNISEKTCFPCVFACYFINAAN